MADIYYLKPAVKQAANANAAQSLRPVSGGFSIVLSLSQLAAVILKETITIDRAFTPRLSAMIDSLQQSAGRTLSGAGGPSPSSSNAISANPSLAKRPAASAISSGYSRAASDEKVAAGKLDAIVVEVIAAGSIRLGSQQRVYSNGGAAHPVAVRMLADHVGVPPEILVARQNRTQTASFSFSSLTSVEGALNTVFRSNSMMIQGWAERGGRPPLHLRVQGKEPFGIIAHTGADEVTDLRGLAVSLEMERSGSGQHVKISMNVTAPPKR